MVWIVAKKQKFKVKIQIINKKKNSMKRVSTLLRGFFLLVCCLAVASLASAQNSKWGGWCYKDFSSNGTFTVPSNCTQLYIEAVGAGGGGGNAAKPSTSVATRTGTGGGGGAYARKHVTNPSGSYTITIGIGGGAAAAGGATTVTGTGCNITAGGGQPGSSNINGVGTTGNGGNGGTAIGGDDNFTGGRGGKVCDNRITTAGSAHDRVGSGAGGGAAGGNGNGGYQDQPQTSGSNRPNSIGTVGAGGGGTAHELSNNYSSVSTWYKGGNGGQGLYGTSGWGDGSTGGYPGGGGGGARAHGGLFGDAFFGGSGANGFVRVWFYIEKAEPLTVNIENQSTTCPYTLNATTSNYLFTNTLKWSNNSTASSITVSPSGSTTYSATVTDAYNGASHTCQITSTKSITVDGCSDCGVSIASATTSPTSVCEGGTATLTASVESPDANATYQWSVNGSNAGTGASLSYTVTPSGTTTYTVSVTVTKGSCSASDSRNVDVTVNTKVDPTFDASLLKDYYCVGSVPAAADLPTTSTNGITGTWTVTTSGSVTFTFTPSTGECANPLSKQATLVDAPTPGTIEPNIVVCDGTETYQFNNDESAAGGVNGQYAWQGSLDQNTWMTIPNANADHYVPMTDLNALAALLDVSATGTFYFRRVWTNDCGDVYSNVLSLDNPGTLSPGSITLDHGDEAGAYCAGASITATLTANPTAELTGATFSYQWQSSTDGTNWTNISNATASSYTVSVTNVQNNISYRYQVKYSTCDWLTSNNTYDITVNELPTVAINPVDPICYGQSATLVATGATSYSWDNDLGTGNNKEVTPTSTTIYSVTGTDDNGCTNTASVTVTVKDLPTVSASANPTTICNGQSTTLTAEGAATYSWDNELGTGASKTVSPTSTTTYKVTGTGANGCSNTASVNVTVKDLPTVSASANPTTICAGKSTTLTAEGATSYSWDNELGTGASKTVSPASTTTYKVTGTGTNGCSNTASVTVTVNPLPTFEITANNVSVCTGKALNLNASTTAEGCNISYSWSGPNSFSSTEQNPTVSSSAAATDAGTYTVSVTATNTTTNCTASKTKNVIVTVNALPTVLINGENPLAAEKCKNQDITLTASGASTYKWSGSGSTANPATFSAAGTYTVTGTDANGCKSTAEVTISENTLAVSITETLVKCYTQAQGYVKYEITGGHPLFRAVLVKDDVEGASTQIGNGVTQFNGGIAAGTYKIKVTEIGETQCTVYSDPVDVAFPTVTFTAPAAETFTLPYGVGEMNVTLEGTPTFTPTDGAFTYDNNLSELNPMGVGPHTVTWTLYDACGEVITSKPQTVTINLPDCETAVELDGYNYPVVRVGYDCWFKENVKATTGIADVVAYDNDEASNKDKFGMLYTWHAAVANLNTAPESGSEEEPGSGPASMMPMPIPPVDATERTQGICPEGWAIPTQEDFERLFTNAGGDIAYLKDMDPTTWIPGKGGITPSTGFDARGAGYYVSEVTAFKDLLSNTRFWTDKANAGETKATCCEFNYYCSEPMFKEISAFDKLSVRCIKINTDELPTPPPTSDCPSIGTPTFEFIDENINNYNYDYTKLTLIISTPIIDYDDDMVGNATYYAYYADNPGDLPSDHTLASTGFNNPDYAEAYFTEDGVFVAKIHGQNCYYGEPCNDFFHRLSQLGRVDINVKVAINCAADGVEWLMNVPFKPETTNCPAYEMTPIPESVSEESVDVKAYINEFTSGSVDVNNISWTVTSDEGVTKTYTPANNSGNAVDGFDISVGIQISADYGNYQWISLSGDQIAADFGEPASLTFTPSMGTTCDGESVTVTGFSATYPYMPATIDDDCPTVDDNMFEIMLENGFYNGEIPFNFEGTGSVSVSGSYYITPYTTIAPTKYDMTGDMYNVTNDNTVQVHISANAIGLPGELGEGETLHVSVTIEYDECGVLVVGTYPSFDCPTPVVNEFELSVVNDNYYAEISYTGGSGNENVNGFYTTGSSMPDLTPYLTLDKTNHKIIVSIPTDEVILAPGQVLTAVVNYWDDDDMDEICGGNVQGTYQEPAAPAVECPMITDNAFELEKVNSYYAVIDYEGGSGNETVSGYYYTTSDAEEIDFQLDETLWLDKTEHTITVTIPFANVELEEGDYLYVSLTLSDQGCDDIVMLGEYYEEPEEEPIPECPNPESTELDLEKVNSYYVQIPYTGGSGNETVSGVYFIGEVMGETNYPLNNQTLVLDKTNKTITVSIPFTQVTLNPGQTIGVVLTLSDGDCNPMTIYCQYTEPACPSMGASNLPETIDLNDLTITTPVTDLTDLNAVTSYGYHIVATVTLAAYPTNPITYEITVDQSTEQVNVQLTTTQLSISANLLGLISADFQELLPMMSLENGYVWVNITPFITVSDTSCGDNGEITGETIVYPEP